MPRIREIFLSWKFPVLQYQILFLMIINEYYNWIIHKFCFNAVSSSLFCLILQALKNTMANDESFGMRTRSSGRLDHTMPRQLRQVLLLLIVNEHTILVNVQSLSKETHNYFIIIGFVSPNRGRGIFNCYCLGWAITGSLTSSVG